MEYSIDNTMLEHRRLNPPGERPTINSLGLQLRSSTQADPSLPPVWLSTTSFAYASGCSVFKYSLRGPECLPMTRAVDIRAIRALQSVEKEGRTGVLYLGEGTTGKWVLALQMSDDEQAEIAVLEKYLHQDRGRLSIALLHNQRHLAVCSSSSGVQHIDIYNLNSCSLIAHQASQYEIATLFPKGEYGFLMLDSRGLSANAYGVECIDTGQIIPVQGAVLQARLLSNGVVLLVQPRHITLVETETDSLESGAKTFALPETTKILAVGICDAYVVIATVERLLVVHYSIRTTEVYWEKKWIEIRGVESAIGLFVSPHCQNILLLCENLIPYIGKPTEPHPALPRKLLTLELVSLDILPPTKPVILAPNRLPMDWSPTPTLSLCTSNLKEELWRLTHNSVVCLPFDGQQGPPIALDQPTCMDVDPNGLYLLVGFEFYFNVFAIRREGLTMVHSQPALSPREVCYLTLYPIFVVMFKHEFRIYNKNTYQELHQEEVSHSSSHFLTFRVNQVQGHAVFLETTGKVFVYDLTQRVRLRELNIKIDSGAIFEYDWILGTALWTDGQQTLVVEPQKQYHLAERITSLKLCQELGVLFVGDCTGALTALSWPSTLQLRSVTLFPEALTHLALSADRCRVFACSSRGNLATLSVAYACSSVVLTRDSIINTLRSLGIGLSTFYLKNLTLEINEKRLESEIRELEIENERKHILYEEEVEELASKLNEKSTDHRNRYKKHRHGVLIRHRNTLRVSKRQLRALEKQLAGISDEGNSPEDISLKYRQLIHKGDTLRRQKEGLQHQFQKEIEEAKGKYGEELTTLLKDQQRELRDKELFLKTTEHQQDQDICDYTCLLTHPELPPLEDTLQTLTLTLQHLYSENDQLNVRGRYLADERQRYECRRMEYRDILPELEEDVQRIISEDQTKKLTSGKITEQLAALEEKLNSEEYSERFQERAKIKARIAEMMGDEVKGHQQIEKHEIILQKLEKEIAHVELMLVGEAQKGATIVKDQLKLAQTKKCLQEKLGQARYSQHLARYKAQLAGGSCPSNSPTSTPQSRSCLVVDELCTQKDLRQLRTNNLSKCFKSRLKIHIKENEQLLQDANNLTMEHKTNVKVANDRKEQAGRRMRGSMVGRGRQDSSKQAWMTPFLRYHKRENTTTTRASRSENCSFIGPRALN